MSEVALVYPYVYRQVRNAMLFHPLGIAHLSALLRRRGMDTLVQDHTFRIPGQELDILTESRPKIVGIYIMLTMIEDALSLARKIRKAMPGTVLICGGPMPTLRPGQFSGEFDVVFQGEASESFPAFCEDYLNLQSLPAVLKEYRRYPGIHARDGKNHRILTMAGTHSGEEELNRLPLPDRSDFEHQRYQQFWKEREGYSPAGIMTTYGCPHACDFCSKPVYGDLFRRRSMDRIMEEIRDIRSLGYDGLWIADDCFTLDTEHVRRFCERMIRENLRMEWTCLSRTDGLSEEVIDLMRGAGCRKMFFGLESGSNEVLRLMNKHTTVEKSEQTVRMISGKGIRTAGFFMVGYPGENYQTIEQTIDWALNLPLDEISFTIPFPLPGTKLFQKVSGLCAEADWGYENENRMIYASEFDEGYLNKRIEETYARFEAGKRQ
jgi:anaerobic magnesium-protoporphyrin IX monomethyl ester cyclase